jgi:hypothetical protein
VDEAGFFYKCIIIMLFQRLKNSDCGLIRMGDVRHFSMPVDN